MQQLLQKFTFLFLFSNCLFNAVSTFAQNELDIVDPYQMKVSRSAQADTFYFTQNATGNLPVKKLDTLRTYDVFLEERPTPFGTAYMCNGNEITHQKYLIYKQFWNATGACKPCLLYTYDDKDQLKYIAFQYEDCLCGSYVEYYKDGTKKVEGQFIQNNSQNWKDIKARNLCNKRDGVWTYYLPNGETEKVELYVDGKLKEEKNIPPPTDTKNQSTKINEQVPKKGIFQRVKQKNKSEEN